MTVSVKMLEDIVLHAQAMADSAQAMAAAMRLVVEDCSEQLAVRKRAAEESCEHTVSPASRESEAAKDPGAMATPKDPSAIGEPDKSVKTIAEPSWLADAEAAIYEPLPGTGKHYSVAEVRSYIAERTNPENRAKVKAILNGFGVAKLTELPEDKYAVLMEEVAKL